MNLVFSNGPAKDFVITRYQSMVHKSTQLWIAAPYVTMTQELFEAANRGKKVYLLAGLNTATSPQALAKIHGVPNCEVRYFTRRFHAKIYLFDSEALVGSSNLTDGGLQSNREATICVTGAEELDELRALFNELWESALVLTMEKLAEFTRKCEELKRPRLDLDALIEDAVGRAEPRNINVSSGKRTAHGIFLEELRRQVQQYRAAFSEVTGLLETHQFRRPELENAGTAIETNRFLNWVRLTYVVGDEAWAHAPFRSHEERQAEIVHLGREWTTTHQNKIPEDFLSWLQLVRTIFASPDAIEVASKEQLTAGLMSIHAFNEQYRFVKEGDVATSFWNMNNQDVAKVKRTLTYLVHGGGEFIQRLNEVLYDPLMKLGHFGRFCALELYGTIKPEDCPPMNGRMAKALRYLGFNVRGQ